MRSGMKCWISTAHEVCTSHSPVNFDIPHRLGWRVLGLHRRENRMHRLSPKLLSLVQFHDWEVEKMFLLMPWWDAGDPRKEILVYSLLWHTSSPGLTSPWIAQKSEPQAPIVTRTSVIGLISWLRSGEKVFPNALMSRGWPWKREKSQKLKDIKRRHYNKNFGNSIRAWLASNEGTNYY